MVHSSGINIMVNYGILWYINVYYGAFTLLPKPPKQEPVRPRREVRGTGRAGCLQAAGEELPGGGASGSLGLGFRV